MRRPTLPLTCLVLLAVAAAQWAVLPLANAQEHGGESASGVCDPCHAHGCSHWGVRGWWHRRHPHACPMHLAAVRSESEAPHGTTVNAHRAALQAAAYDRSLYFPSHEFVRGSTALTAAGRRHWEKIQSKLPETAAPIVVEDLAGAPELSEARRQTLAQVWKASGTAFDAQRLLLRSDISGGVTGLEASAIQQNLEQQTRYRGVVPWRTSPRIGVEAAERVAPAAAPIPRPSSVGSTPAPAAGSAPSPTPQ